MRIFITGANGQLGHDCIKECVERGHDVIASDITFSYSGFDDGSDVTSVPYVRLNITILEDVLDVISQLEPDVIIHCAAWTDVDGAEDNKNKNSVYAVNVCGTTFLARAANQVNAKMVYISTDYVFDGRGQIPWEVTDNTHPINYYGATKKQGELGLWAWVHKYFIIRTSWVFGISGKNFVKTMLKLDSEVSVINDQIGRPTYTVDLAELIADMIETDKYGIYHATNSGEYISWYDFAKEIFKLAHKDIKVNPVLTYDYASKTKRPLNSRLDTSYLTEQGFNQLPDWHNALCRYLKELKEAATIE